MLKFDIQSLSSRVIAILDRTSGSLTLFNKKCLMLHCNIVMKVTNKKKGILLFYSHYMDKKFSGSHFLHSGVNASIKCVNDH